MLKRKKDEQLTALLLADDSDEEAANRSLETENNRHQILNTTSKGWVCFTKRALNDKCIYMHLESRDIA